MVYRLLFVLFILTGCRITNTKAQYENVWAFGAGFGLDFNSGTPVPITTSMNGYGEACASICDENGRLLFYTNGFIVWDGNGAQMPNGYGLTPVWNSFSPAVQSSSQGALIVPMPDSIHKFYIFSMTSQEQGENMGRLYYSVVDLNLNFGAGDIVPIQKGILVDTGLSEKVTAVLGERCNIWILAHDYARNKLNAYELTFSGVSRAPVTSALGSGNGEKVGYIAVASDRTKLAITNTGSQMTGMPSGSLCLYNFDPLTGTASDPRRLSDSNAYGACFAPDNSKLYCTRQRSGNAGRSQLLQYDLDADNITDIINSEVTLGNALNITHLKLAKDGRMYFWSGADSENEFLGRINAPNLSGAAAGYESDVLFFKTRPVAGLPNPVNAIWIPNPDTIVSSRVVNSKECFPSTYLLQLDSDRWGISWEDGSTLLRREITDPGVYWVTSKETSCLYYVDTFVILPAGRLPELFIEPACKGDANGKASLEQWPQDTTVYQFLWRNRAGIELSNDDTLRDLRTGNYSVQITSRRCDTTLFFEIQETDYLASFATDTIICTNKPLNIQNTSDDYFDNFTWSFGNGDTSSAEIPQYEYTNGGEYRISLIASGILCNDTAYFTVTVDTPIAAVGFLTDIDQLCVGQHISFKPILNGAVVDLTWDFGEGNSKLTVDRAIQHAYDEFGTKKIRMIARFRACPEMVYIDTIEVYNYPNVDIGIDTAICLNGAVYTLNNYMPYKNGERYLWNTGDTTPEIKVRHHGSYSLTIIGKGNCAASDTVKIEKSCYVDIPNAFTPNGNGENDFFFPKQTLAGRLTKFDMKIFNRWGQIIFQTSQTNGRGWDGRFNGQLQPEGVYIYQIDVEINERYKESYRGNVTLIR